VVRTERWTALVDTCCGNHKPAAARAGVEPAQPALHWKNMSALGVRPEDIDFVMCTHLQRRSRRLEHAVDRRTLGPDLPQCALI